MRGELLFQPIHCPKKLSTYFHQKLNGTESQRTPDQVSCEKELLDTERFFSGSVKRRSCGSDFLEYLVLGQRGFTLNPLNLMKFSWESKGTPQSYPPQEIAGPNSRPY